MNRESAWRSPRVWLGALDLVVAALLLFGIWVALPARWWPVDLLGSGFAALLIASGFLLFTRWPLAEQFSLAVCMLWLFLGATLCTTLFLTAASIAGLYGPVGAGGAIIFAIVALMTLPYLVVLPAAQAFYHLRPR
ncbi:MAG: hypothetical protein AAF355_10330 [Myxococcota bacterium]